MDSLTHIVLGAAIGEGTLGKQAGKKAMLWGAVLATAPDADVLIGAFMNDLDKMIFHRGLTHSFFFIALVSPLYGWLISKLSKATVNWKQWTLLAFLAQITHALLDSLTSYGTQILMPFSSKAVAVSTISVIDPIFTLPLIISCLFLLFKSNQWKYRQVCATAGFFVASGYLLFTVFNKYQVEQRFITQLEDKGVEIVDLDVKPTLLNNILWRGIAHSGDGIYHVGYFSTADGRDIIDFLEIDGNHHLLRNHMQLISVQRLIWVSNGFFKIEEYNDGFIFNDLRFGRVAEFSGDDSPYAFSYTLIKDSGASDFTVERIELQIDRSREGGSIRKLWNRMFGLN